MSSHNPSDSTNHGDLYDKSYFDVRAHDFKRKAMYSQEFDRIKSKTGLEGGDVLDIGCGLGEFLEHFPSQKWNRYGIEVSQYAVDICQKKGISFNLSQQPEIFDLIVLRGTLQHLDQPLDTLKMCYRWLRPGGWVCVLATPNAGGPVYRLFQDLPALDPPRNFIVFSDKILNQCLSNLGFRNISLVYPYWSTPYASIFKDHINFVLRCIGIKTSFAFWRNMMECYAKK